MRPTHVIVTGLALVAAATFAAQPQTFTPQHPEVLWRTDLKVLPSNTFDKQRVAFSPDGRWIGAVYQPRDAAIVRASDGALVRELPVTALSGAYSIAFSPKSDRAAVGRFGGVEVLDVPSGRTERVFRCDCLVEGLGFSPDGSLLAFQGAAGPQRPLRHTTVVEIESGRYVTVLDVTSGRAHVAFSPDGTQLVASSFHGPDQVSPLGFRVWNTEDWSAQL
jgi:WD40 repeat protein